MKIRMLVQKYSNHWIEPHLVKMRGRKISILVKLQGRGLRDHPYITSAHSWTFSDPPTLRQQKQY